MRYIESFPEDLDAAWSRGAIAVVPIGALEWHGSHLPLGLDGIVAERFAESLADRLDGVLLPTFYTPITTLPHRHSLQVPTDALRLILDETLAGLYRSGARTVAVVTGHYAQGHEIELYEAALRAMEDHDEFRVLAATPLEVLGDDSLLDHAGRYETSQFLTIRPELVRVGGLPQVLDSKEHAVLGEHPSLGTEEEGRRLLDLALSAWAEWLSGRSVDELVAFYRGRFDAYQGYVDAYYEGSWEDAIVKWWGLLG